MITRLRLSVFLGVLAAAPLVIASPAFADDARNPTLAQSLFDQARTLMNDGRYEEACPLLAESQRLDPGGGTLTNLAVCLEGAGKLASAHTKFHEALSLAIADKRDDRKKLAEERIATIGPRLSKLTITVPAEARVPGIKVWLDGNELTSVAWGVATAIDGGEHRIEATAPSRKAFTEIIRVSPEGHRVEVTVRAPEPMFAERPPVVEVPPDVRPPLQRDRVRTPPQKTEKNLSTASFVVGGIGLGALIVGGITGGAAIAQANAASDAGFESGCNFERDYCPVGAGAEAISAADDAETLGWVSTFTLGGGAITFLVALLLPREEVPVQADEKAASIAPFVGPASVGVRGTF